MKSRMISHPLYMSQGMKGLKEYTYVEIKIHHPTLIHGTMYNETNSIHDTSIHHKDIKQLI